MTTAATAAATMPPAEAIGLAEGGEELYWDFRQTSGHSGPPGAGRCSGRHYPNYLRFAVLLLVGIVTPELFTLNLSELSAVFIKK